MHARRSESHRSIDWPRIASKGWTAGVSNEGMTRSRQKPRHAVEAHDRTMDSAVGYRPDIDRPRFVGNRRPYSQLGSGVVRQRSARAQCRVPALEHDQSATRRRDRSAGVFGHARCGVLATLLLGKGRVAGGPSASRGGVARTGVNVGGHRCGRHAASQRCMGGIGCRSVAFAARSKLVTAAKGGQRPGRPLSPRPRDRRARFGRQERRVARESSKAISCG